MAFISPTLAHAQTTQTFDIASYIIAEAQEYGVGPAEPLYIANCESGLNPLAVGDERTSYGIFQIHLPAHADISIEQAEDAKWATSWAIKKYMVKGDFSPWKHCSAQFDHSNPPSPTGTN